jgi:hypothetical protein
MVMDNSDGSVQVQSQLLGSVVVLLFLVPWLSGGEARSSLSLHLCAGSILEGCSLFR